MTTLDTAPLAPLLDRLFAEADVATSPAISALSIKELEQMTQSRTDYRRFYTLAKNLWLPVSRDTGKLLYMLARSTRSRSVVEFGTSFGISTLHLAAALRDNGGGRIITSEFEPSKVIRARQHLMEGGLSDLVEVREGDALNTLATGMPEAIDLLLLDGAKPLYRDILELVEDRLQPGAIVVADNADQCPDYLARVRSSGLGYLSIPFQEDVEVSMWAGRP